jgi:hypothetical protein
MARMTGQDKHDWLSVAATFADGRKLEVIWSRGGGETVRVRPPSPEMAETLSLIVQQSKVRMSLPDASYRNFGDVKAVMQRVGERAANAADYLAGLKAALGVTGERAAPKAVNVAPAQTRVDVRRGRGWVIGMTFPTGERVELTINGRSCGISIDPQVPAKQRAINELVLRAKMAAVMDDETMVSTVSDLAREAVSMDAWHDAIAAVLAPAAPGPRR